MKFALLMTILAFSSVAIEASSGNPSTKLKWAYQNEILEYKSCGCADQCWVAELKQKQSKKHLFSLKCNCEEMLIKTGNQSPKKYKPSCEGFSGQDKFEKIQTEMRILKTKLQHR